MINPLIHLLSIYPSMNNPDLNNPHGKINFGDPLGDINDLTMEDINNLATEEIADVTGLVMTTVAAVAATPMEEDMDTTEEVMEEDTTDAAGELLSLIDSSPLSVD